MGKLVWCSRVKDLSGGLFDLGYGGADGPRVRMGIAGTLNHFVEASAERQKQRGLRA